MTVVSGEPTPVRTQLEVHGMTCASCAARIAKKLNRLDGVTASVNYALGTAAVDHSGTRTSDEFVSVIRGLGYDAEPVRRETVNDASAPDDDDPAAAEERAWRERLIVCALLTVPVVAVSMVPAWQFEYWQWAALTLAAPVAVWGAWPFHRAAAVNLRHGATTMDTLISMGVIAAFGWSLYALFFGHAGMPGMTMEFTWVPARGGTDDIYLEVAAGVTTLIVLGRWFEMRAKARSGSALRALLHLGAKDVAVLRDGREVRIPVDALGVGDRFIVRPGERIAADGTVERGGSGIDTSMVTGESVPREVAVGDAVAGGTVVVDGVVTVVAERVGTDTTIARLAELVRRAQDGKAPVQRLADRVSAVFVPIVIVLAIATFVAWWAIDGDLEQAFTAAVAVLIVACPCALGLATPTALLVGTGRAAQLGIVVRGPEVLESTRRIDTIVLDKTGTITDARMQVVEVLTIGATPAELLRMAASVERGSEHPTGVAIVQHATAEGLDLPAIDAFVATRGRGVSGNLPDGTCVKVGRRDWVSPPSGTPIDAAVERAQEAGRSVVWVARGDALIGAVVVADAPRPTSRTAIDALRGLGLEPWVISGDSAAVTRAVGEQVGIGVSRAIGEVLPEDKLARVAELQQDGAVVAMVGDGVNDAAALVQADLGIAMGDGTDVAIEASDLTLIRNDLLTVVDAIGISRATLRTIKGNLFWAFAYNVAALPLAALGLLNPLIAGAAMAFSSVFVVSNSLRLRGWSTSR
jgi:Cu+-exporting ATPase